MYNGQPFPFTTSLQATSSDSTVLACCAIGESVGQATLTYTYANLTASVGIAVTKNADGASAFFAARSGGTGAVWLPDSLQVPVGSLVEFSIFADHNVVFDSVAGAPADIPALPAGTRTVTLGKRTFATPGTFRFTCTTHRERGVVVVTP
jgi:plastocyanin